MDLNDLESDQESDVENASPAQNDEKLYDSDQGSDNDEQAEFVADVVRKVVAAYGVEDGGGAVPDVDLDSVRERLASRLQSCTQHCLICLQRVSRTDAIWSCEHCFECYHLACAQKWAQHAKEAGAEQVETPCWHCPKCRGPYPVASVPSKYTCFCGKELEPKPNPWVPAHCCDQLCDRQLAKCQHRCKLLCHPGPCPPCPKIVSTSCHCGRSAKTARRCGDKLWSCNKTCARALDCAVHACKLACHPGDCSPCELTTKRSCRCGAKSDVVPCSEGDWQCGKVCAKVLPCGRHKCESVCHKPPCAPCVRPGSNTCPCGKRVYGLAGADRTVCIDDLPCCGDTCGKKLACSLHECMQQCHRGECPPCMVERSVRCRCGMRQKVTACSKGQFLCDTKCRLKRNCGRHTCNQKCCDGRCPPCSQACGRQLNCGRHKCDAPCHRGPCYPCQQVVKLSCPCSKTTLQVACARARKTRPPNCNRLCTKAPPCHHEKAVEHKCHQGACPPCQQICEKMLQCGHECEQTCHSYVLVDINADPSAPVVQRAPPTAKTPTSFWNKHQTQLEHRSLPCPPCEAPIQVSCLGMHETVDMPCHQAKSTSCGRRCGNMLACENHICEKICHLLTPPPTAATLILSTQSAATPEQCDTCMNMCSLPRPEGCTHACPKRCHKGKCRPCENKVQQLCYCRMNALFLPCPSVWNKMPKTERDNLRSCGHRCPYNMSCGHQCSLSCHQLTPSKDDKPTKEHVSGCVPAAVDISTLVGKKLDGIVCGGAEGCKKRVLVKCPCGVKSVKMPCNMVGSDTSEPVVCDSLCETAVQKENQASDTSAPNNGDYKIQPKASSNTTIRRRKTPPWKRKENDANDQWSIFQGKYLLYSIFGAAAVGLGAVAAAYIFELI